MEQVHIYPIEKKVAGDIAVNHDYGDLIKHVWIEDQSTIQKPERLSTAKAHNDYQLKLLSFVEGLKKHLLEDHKMLLVNVRGEGYRIAQPKEQAQIGIDTLHHHIKKGIGYAAKAMTHVDSGRLTDQERQQNTDALAMVQRLAHSSKQQLTGFRLTS